MRNLAPRQQQALHYGPALLTLYIASISLGALSASALDGTGIDSNGAGLGEADAQHLASYRLAVPVVGVTKQNLRDTYNERRGGHLHEALDIPAPRGTQVIAAGDGRVVKLFRSVAGGLTVYQFDPTEQFAYYYAHLDHYAQSLTEGMMLKRGDPIGAVGTTGNARDDSPHLHFAIFKLGPEKRWWKGSPVNAFPLLN
jgi:murein DD-endopeptidase MepM/ murein hydrolase activator NlpD